MVVLVELLLNTALGPNKKMYRSYDIKLRPGILRLFLFLPYMSMNFLGERKKKQTLSENYRQISYHTAELYRFL